MQYKTKQDSKFNSRGNSMVSDGNNSKNKLFLSCSQQDTDKKASAELKKQLHREVKDVFMGIGHFNGKFSLQTKPHSIRHPQGM